jgi:tetratricopeptide (TPR) repeat protein
MNYIRDHYDYARPDPDHPATLRGRSAWQRWLYGLAQKHLGRSAAYPKEPIWIPGDTDTQQAFALYVQELQTRPAMPGEEVRIEGGRVNVQGVQGVMAINGFLTKMIFERNKDNHSFYVEESYAIPWMYPYLEPYGIILKLNKEPLQQFDAGMVARDREYWDDLTQELQRQPEFRRDDMAQKTFSKLRSAIGGLYAFRQMFSEAEYAYRQAIDLCPDNPEGNFRLAQLYVETGRFDDAMAVLEQYRRRDPYNVKIREAMKTMQEIQKQVAKQQELEQQLTAQPGNLSVALQLIGVYAQRQRLSELDTLVNAVIGHPDLSSVELLQIANLHAQLRRLDRCAELLTRFTQRYPQDPVGWYNLAIVRSTLRQCDEAALALERALVLDGPAGQVRNTARQDPRFGYCRRNSRFQLLMEQGATPLPGGFTITR